MARALPGMRRVTGRPLYSTPATSPLHSVAQWVRVQVSKTE
jgi:hypothetical protein